MRTHEANRKKVLKNSISEVNLFVVDNSMQGKGVGRKLINEFITLCRNEKLPNIILETEKSSNYRFYEHLGFKVIASFDSPMQNHFNGSSGETFIYELTL